MSDLVEYIKHTRHFDGLGMGDQDIEQRAKKLQDRVAEQDALIKMHVPNVELILRMLQDSPFPTPDLRWQFVGEWCKQFIKLHKHDGVAL